MSFARPRVACHAVGFVRLGSGSVCTLALAPFRGWCGATAGVDVTVIGAFRGACAAMGLAATFVSAPLVSRLGLLNVSDARSSVLGFRV